MGEVNMGDYQTLKELISYSKNNYPAERYLVSMYSHGSGWKGACPDKTNFFDQLTMDEMQKAFNETGGIDILCFTAPCLMGAIESAYELRDCVDVYIGSEETSGYRYWVESIDDICNILNNNPDLSSIGIGEQIIQVINSNCYTGWNEEMKEEITMSSVRTDKMEELANSIDIVARNLIENYQESRKKLWSIYDDIQKFSRKGGIIDIYDFAEKYYNVETNTSIRQNLQNLMNNIEESVIAECHGSNHPGAHGLSIYFPKRKIMYNPLYDNPNYGLDFSQNTHWDEFLQNYIKPVQKSINQLFNTILARFLDSHPHMFPMLRALLRL